MANLLDRARSQFKVVDRRTVGWVFQASPPDDDGRILEFYPPGEEDSFDPDHYAIETFGSAARVLDVAGEVASHYLVKGHDLTMVNYYTRFARSLNYEQHAHLVEQYQYAVDNNGEERPYETWKTVSGLPAYFRGWPFQQGWPPSFYTAKQRTLLDNMMRYLRTGKVHV